MDANPKNFCRCGVFGLFEQISTPTAKIFRRHSLIVEGSRKQCEKTGAPISKLSLSAYLAAILVR
jgi:hypothetical protein